MAFRGLVFRCVVKSVYTKAMRTLGYACSFPCADVSIKWLCDALGRQCQLMVENKHTQFREKAPHLWNSRILDQSITSVEKKKRERYLIRIK